MVLEEKNCSRRIRKFCPALEDGRESENTIKLNGIVSIVRNICTTKHLITTVKKLKRKYSRVLGILRAQFGGKKKRVLGSNPVCVSKLNEL